MRNVRTILIHIEQAYRYHKDSLIHKQNEFNIDLTQGTYQASAPTLPTPGTSATLRSELPLPSPKTVRSMCVGLTFRLRITISPVAETNAWLIYRELLSFSLKPSRTAMLCSFAHAAMFCISGESTLRLFLMYFVPRLKSTGRLQIQHG